MHTRHLLMRTYTCRERTFPRRSGVIQGAPLPVRIGLIFGLQSCTSVANKPTRRGIYGSTRGQLSTKRLHEQTTWALGDQRATWLKRVAAGTTKLAYKLSKG